MTESYVTDMEDGEDTTLAPTKENEKQKWPYTFGDLPPLQFCMLKLYDNLKRFMINWVNPLQMIVFICSSLVLTIKVNGREIKTSASNNSSFAIMFIDKIN